MHIEKFIFSYEEKRSVNFQSAGAGLSVEYTLDDGENPSEAYQKVKNATIAKVRATAEEAIAPFRS